MRGCDADANRRALYAAVLAVAVAGAAVAPMAALAAAPALILALLLVRGIFPGEAAIERCRRWLNDKPRRAPAAFADTAGRPIRRLAGWLIAFALAMRPPPAAGLARTAGCSA